MQACEDSGSCIAVHHSSNEQLGRARLHVSKAQPRTPCKHGSARGEAWGSTSHGCWGIWDTGRPSWRNVGWLPLLRRPLRICSSICPAPMLCERRQEARHVPFRDWNGGLVAERPNVHCQQAACGRTRLPRAASEAGSNQVVGPRVPRELRCSRLQRSARVRDVPSKRHLHNVLKAVAGNELRKAQPKERPPHLPRSCARVACKVAQKLA